MFLYLYQVNILFYNWHNKESVDIHMSRMPHKWNRFTNIFSSLHSKCNWPQASSPSCLFWFHSIMLVLLWWHKGLRICTLCLFFGNWHICPIVVKSWHRVGRVLEAKNPDAELLRSSQHCRKEDLSGNINQAECTDSQLIWIGNINLIEHTLTWKVHIL